MTHSASLARPLGWFFAAAVTATFSTFLAYAGTRLNWDTVTKRRPDAGPCSTALIYAGVAAWLLGLGMVVLGGVDGYMRLPQALSALSR